uniref:Bm1758 n=1 Tax=Brugia malayi TaxID=6279 RepID=A0A0H5SFA1_BRUMA|nr:Bm1758 [Brugia malayi]
MMSYHDLAVQYIYIKHYKSFNANYSTNDNLKFSILIFSLKHYPASSGEV